MVKFPDFLILQCWLMLKNGILACALFRFYWKITGWGTPFEKTVEIKKKRMPKCFFWAWPSTAKFNFWRKFHTGRKSKENTALKIDWFLLCLNGLFRGIVRRVPESVYRFFVFGRFPFGFPIVRIRQNIQKWIHKWAQKRPQDRVGRELTPQEIFSWGPDNFPGRFLAYRVHSYNLYEILHLTI